MKGEGECVRHRIQPRNEQQKSDRLQLGQRQWPAIHLLLHQLADQIIAGGFAALFDHVGDNGDDGVLNLNAPRHRGRHAEIFQHDAAKSVVAFHRHTHHVHEHRHWIGATERLGEIALPRIDDLIDQSTRPAAQHVFARRDGFLVDVTHYRRAIHPVIRRIEIERDHHIRAVRARNIKFAIREVLRILEDAGHHIHACDDPMPAVAGREKNIRRTLLNRAIAAMQILTQPLIGIDVELDHLLGPHVGRYCGNCCTHSFSPLLLRVTDLLPPSSRGTKSRGDPYN